MKDSLVCSQAKYLTGWSHGVETLKPGVFDTQKGSFYVNCGAFIHAQQPVAEARDEFPEYTAPNVWPPEPSLPGFRTAFEELCTTIVSVAALVARACDRYAAAHIVEYESGYLERVVRESTTTKARLLHYFPPPAHRATADAEADTDDDSWCTTHIDHGCLTGLTSALYTDESKPLPETSAGAPLPALPLLSKAPDNAAGLYIRSRTGQTTKVSIPPTCLAFQTGEALELVTEGKFRAVPHFVRSGGKGMEGVARNTLAVFTQPGLDEVVDRGRGLTFRDFSKEVVGRHKPQA